VFICFVFVIIFLWQLILIPKSIYDLLVEIEVASLDNQLNETIPRIIHQMWKSDNLLTHPTHLEWKKSYPNYKINLWTDKQIEELVLKDEFIELYSTYKSYFYGIQSADLARLITVDAEGGIYIDLDVYPSLTNIENLRLKGDSLMIGRLSSDICSINHILMGEKKKET